MNCDIYFTGVGGQGILTIGEVLAETAVSLGIPSNFYPSKGMAQRGGFVKAQLRLGREHVGPNIPPRGADIVVSMEVSESLKALPLIKEGGEFVLLGDVWAPTAVALGKAPYPALEQVKEQIHLAGARLIYIDPALLPVYQGEAVRSNLFVLGVLIHLSALKRLFQPSDVEQVIRSRFSREVESNLFAFRCGLAHSVEEAA